MKMKKVTIFLFLMLAVFLAAIPVAVAEYATLCRKTSDGFETIRQSWIDPEINGNFCRYTDRWPVDGEVSLRLSDGEKALLFDGREIFCQISTEPVSCESTLSECLVEEIDMPSVLNQDCHWFQIFMEPWFNPYPNGNNEFGYAIYRRFQNGNWTRLDNFVYDDTLKVLLLTKQESADGVTLPCGAYDFAVVPNGIPPESMNVCARSAQVNFRAERTEEIAWVHDITYKWAKWWPEDSSTPSEELKTRLYIPKEFSGPYPIVIYLHPGGGALGDKSDLAGRYPLETMSLLQAPYGGMAVIVPDYSLNPGVNWNGSSQSAWNAVEDIDDLLRWLNTESDGMKNYQWLNLDPNYVFLAGTSFGGYLSLMVGFLQGEIDSGYYQSEPLPVRHVIANSGFWNLEDWIPSNRYIRGMVADFIAFYPTITIDEYMDYRLTFGMWETYDLFRIPETDKFWFDPGFVDKKRGLSPATFVDRAWKLESIQISHGRRDIIIPFDQAVEAVEDLNSIGYPVIFLHHDGGHGASPTAFQKALDNIQGK